MTLFMPPIQRKKKVEEKYNPDTFRVISETAESDHPKYRPLPYRASFEPRTPTPRVVQKNNNAVEGSEEIPLTIPPLRPLKTTRVLPQVLPDYREHNPHPRSCGFLDRNVRFLNEPICNVYTAPVKHEEARWWPARANPGELVIPPYAEDTRYRIDYSCRFGDRPGGSGRHTCNTNREPALGTIPVNYLRERDGTQRFYKEGLSYEHMYNSRSDPNYPIRGKRHGAFVWSRMDPISQQKFIEYYQRVEEEERKAQECGYDGPLSPSKAGSAPVIRSPNQKRSSVPNSPKRKASNSSSVGRLEKQISVQSDRSNNVAVVDNAIPVASLPAAVTAATTEVSQPPVEASGNDVSQTANSESKPAETAEE